MRCDNLTGLMLAFLLLMLGACEPDEATPELVTVESLPTRAQVPSPTLTDTCTPTPSVTPSPTWTFPPSATPTATATPTVTPVIMQDVVVVVQPIPAGYAVPPEAVKTYPWPQHGAPIHGFPAAEEVINQVTRVELACYEPVLRRAVAPREVGDGFRELESGCPGYREPAEVTYQEVVIAARDIQRGDRLLPSVVTLRPWPAHMLPPGALTSLSQAVGQVARVDIVREQPILRSRLR